MEGIIPIRANIYLDSLVERARREEIFREVQGVGDNKGVSLSYGSPCISPARSRSSSVSSLSDCLSDMSVERERVVEAVSQPYLISDDLDASFVPPESSSPIPSSPVSYQSSLARRSLSPMSRSVSPIPLPSRPASAMSGPTSPVPGLPSAAKTAGHSVERARARKQARKRRHQKAIKRAEHTLQPSSPIQYRVRSSTSIKYSKPIAIKSLFSIQKMPTTHGSFTGLRQKVVRKRPFQVDELMTKGFELRKWDGR